MSIAREVAYTQPAGSEYQLDNAVSALIHEIEDGAEFPDAHFRIQRRFGIDGEMLKRAYDLATGGS